MNNNNTWNKFKSGYIRLVILTLISLIAGLSMIIAPEGINTWVIRGVGLVWSLDGISYGLDIWIKYAKSK